jgi:chemotaxis protein histidine kinase CheA
MRVLTKAINGHLHIESKLYQCTTFTVAVPVQMPIDFYEGNYETTKEYHVSLPLDSVSLKPDQEFA